MDPHEFAVLFPHADPDHFYGRRSDAGKIYYVTDEWEYINPESIKFWNHDEKGIKLLHLSKEAEALLASFPVGKKEQFLVVWKKRHEGKETSLPEKTESVPVQNTAVPLSFFENVEHFLHTHMLRMDVVFVLGLIVFLKVKK